MRQVKVVATDELMPHQIEETLNEVLAEIHNNGGFVEKTEYVVCHQYGTITAVVIEYET